MAMESDDDDVLYDSSGFNGNQDKTLIGGQAKTLDEIMNTPRHRMKKTFGLCAAFLGLGLSVAVLGPTLRSLKMQVGQDSMESMAIVFSGRGLGYLGGTILGGVFFEYWNPQVLMAVGLALSSLGMFIVVFSKGLFLLVVMMSCVGIAMGVLDTGATNRINSKYRQKENNNPVIPGNNKPATPTTVNQRISGRQRDQQRQREDMLYHARKKPIKPPTDPT